MFIGQQFATCLEHARFSDLAATLWLWHRTVSGGHQHGKVAIRRVIFGCTDRTKNRCYQHSFCTVGGKGPKSGPSYINPATPVLYNLSYLLTYEYSE
jgi:hypothetical protein